MSEPTNWLDMLNSLPPEAYGPTSNLDPKLIAWLHRVEDWHATQAKQMGYQCFEVGCFCDTCEQIIARYIMSAMSAKEFPPPTLPGLVVQVEDDLTWGGMRVWYRYGKGMHGCQWGRAVSSLYFAEHPEEFLPPAMIGKTSVYENMIAAYDKLAGMVKPAEQGYGNSAELLREAIPNLYSATVQCPVEDCSERKLEMESSVTRMVIHLNDWHRWPRAASEADEGQPNIADWLEEWALLNNVDLTFKVPDQEEQEQAS